MISTIRLRLAIKNLIKKVTKGNYKIEGIKIVREGKKRKKELFEKYSERQKDVFLCLDLLDELLFWNSDKSKKGYDRIIGVLIRLKDKGPEYYVTKEFEDIMNEIRNKIKELSGHHYHLFITCHVLDKIEKMREEKNEENG